MIFNKIRHSILDMIMYKIQILCQKGLLSPQWKFNLYKLELSMCEPFFWLTDMTSYFSWFSYDETHYYLFQVTDEFCWECLKMYSRNQPRKTWWSSLLRFTQIWGLLFQCPEDKTELGQELESIRWCLHSKFEISIM